MIPLNWIKFMCIWGIFVDRSLFIVMQFILIILNHISNLWFLSVYFGIQPIFWCYRVCKCNPLFNFKNSLCFSVSLDKALPVLCIIYGGSCYGSGIRVQNWKMIVKVCIIRKEVQPMYKWALRCQEIAWVQQSLLKWKPK